MAVKVKCIIPSKQLEAAQTNQYIAANACLLYTSPSPRD